ncbi:uncharacterized protein [Dermacentor albipictus]|uniref:uncharacterized protein n=1 Tax=Dermacentor albipictus TaxID=60249 RepID=UPI0038FC1316
MESSEVLRAGTSSTHRVFPDCMWHGICMPHPVYGMLPQDEKPNCEVALVVWRPQPQQGRKGRSWFSRGKTASCDESWRSFRHWAVLCSIEGDRNFLLDAVEKNGVLVGRMQNHDSNVEPHEKLPLGVHKRNFNDISEAYVAISAPGKYDKIENHCQKWVVDFLRLMRIKMPPQIRTIQELIPRARLLAQIKNPERLYLADKETDSCATGCTAHGSALIMAPHNEPSCKVTMGFTPIGNRSVQTKFLFSSSSSSTAVSHCFMHWEVYCEFDDGDCWKIEALQEEGKLVPYMRSTETSNLPRDKVFLGAFQLSYEDVSKAVRSKGTIKQYHVLKHNCQMWLIAFLMELKLPIPKEVSTIAVSIGKIFSGHDNPYEFVVKKVSKAFQCTTKPCKGSAPKEEEEMEEI